MPITLIRNTKDNAMHGSDNDRYTGCRMKMQGGTWFTREGELKDITDLTCERCKEVFATKMIRESNKEELRIAKEEKKRYQRAKKQGIVREATYEEYLMNREAEASSKRDSRDDSATSASLHMLRDSIPAEQPAASQSVQFQSPFNPYNQTNTQSQVSAPQGPFNPYAQPQVSAPQGSFNPYAQPQVSAPQGPFNPYAQPQVSVPQGPFDPYAQSQQVSAPQAQFNPYAQPQVSAPQSTFNPYSQNQTTVSQEFSPQVSSQESFTQPVSELSGEQKPQDDGPAPIYQEYTKSSFEPQKETNPSPADEDDFLAQFMFKPSSEPANDKPVSSVTESIKSATDDILSQFNIGSQLAETPSAPKSATVSPAIKADASSFYNNSIPVVEPVYADAGSVNSAVTEFGSLNVAEAPKDDFIVPDVPVYQPQGNSSYVSSNLSASLEDISVSNSFSAAGTQSASNISMQFAELASADMRKSDAADREEMSDLDSEFGFDTLINENSSVLNEDINSTEDFMSGFGDFSGVSSAPVMDGFGSVSPAQPSAPTMSGFDTVSPVYPAAPTMGGFDTVSPVQPSAPTMSGFDTVSPVQPAAPTMGGFDTVSPVQPAAPTMGGFDTVSPVQPAASALNGFGSPAQQNPYSQVQSNTYQQTSNPYAQPQMTQGYGMQSQYASPVHEQKPAASPVFAEKGGTADSIEEALRQLGAEVAAPESQVPDKEEIVPNFVSYVPSSSKVLHTAPPASVSQSAPKRPMSAREAKQLAKIDAKFKKDLISRGFNPNELKNQRRGK